MVVLLICLLLILILLLPVNFRIDGQHDGNTTFRVTIRYLIFSRTWASGQKSRRRPKKKRDGSLLSRLREGARISRFIRQHIHLEALDVLVILHAGDAASAALFSGGLQGIANIPSLYRRKIRIRIMPDFFRGRTLWQSRCIFHIRLGIILLTMLMPLAFRLQQKVRTTYGPSHW